MIETQLKQAEEKRESFAHINEINSSLALAKLNPGAQTILSESVSLHLLC